jgi:putative sterol carrier protein
MNSGVMLPFEIPAGTTLDSLVTDVLPKAHAKLAKGKGRFRGVIRFEGGPSYTVDVDGTKLEARKGEETGAQAWLVTRAATAEKFLADWMGPQRFAPKVAAAQFVLLTDPDVLKRVAMVEGKIELALRDFEGARAGMTFALGSAAKKAIDPEDPGVVVEASVAVLERMLAGKLSPEEALADGDVTVRGKRLVAMQLAFALAPFFPKP